GLAMNKAGQRQTSPRATIRMPYQQAHRQQPGSDARLFTTPSASAASLVSFPMFGDAMATRSHKLEENGSLRHRTRKRLRAALYSDATDRPGSGGLAVAELEHPLDQALGLVEQPRFPGSRAVTLIRLRSSCACSIRPAATSASRSGGVCHLL